MTEEQVAMIVEEALLHLRIDGWYVVDGVIPENEVGAIRDSVEATVQAHGGFTGVKGVGTRKGLLAFNQSFTPYLADERVLGVAQALLGPHVRISFTTAHINYPGNVRGPWHADWPFNQKNAGHIPAPYPDVVMHLTTLWMLSPFTRETGGTLVVPGSHRSPNNPSGFAGIDPNKPYPTEMQAAGSAGSVLILDSRTWHATAPNQTEQPRVGMAVRYAPWWLNLDILMPGSVERARMVDETGGNENEVLPVPRDVYAALPEAVKPLFRHWVKRCQ
ncbi:MAG: phytanoyl-CoA dioxygenase family protein [Candidatus Poribacteria bacterium]|nr:phytanoyl-CoA dioxygenase family protein [Candidatus Poribacteria bacterium]